MDVEAWGRGWGRKMEGSETGGAWVGTGLGGKMEGSETGGAWVGTGLGGKMEERDGRRMDENGAGQEVHGWGWGWGREDGGSETGGAWVGTRGRGWREDGGSETGGAGGDGAGKGYVQPPTRLNREPSCFLLTATIFLSRVYAGVNS